MAHWSVQVGAFASESAARQAASQARRNADDGDAAGGIGQRRGHVTWRALLTGFSRAEARQACAALARHRMACIPIRPEGGQLASK